MRYCCILLILWLPGLTLGQHASMYPAIHSTYFYQPQLVHPGFVPQERKVQISLFYRQRTGAFHQIAHYGFIVSKVIFKANASHQLSALFTNEKEGPYIHFTRVFGSYAYSLKLSSKLRLSSGVAMGVLQTAFTAPTATAYGLFRSPDLALGLMIQHPQFNLGVSSMQLFHTKQKPFPAIISLTNYYNLYGDFKLPVDSKFWTFTSYLLWQLQDGVDDNRLFSIVANYKSSFYIGGGIGSRSGIHFHSGFIFDTSKGKVLIMAGYNSPFFQTKSYFPVQSLELNGVYYQEK